MDLVLVSGVSFFVRSAPYFDLDLFEGVLGPSLGNERPITAKHKTKMNVSRTATAAVFGVCVLTELSCPLAS